MSYQTVPGPVEGPLADNERLKRESNFLRGTIEQDLRDPWYFFLFFVWKKPSANIKQNRGKESLPTARRRKYTFFDRKALPITPMWSRNIEKRAIYFK